MSITISEAAAKALTGLYDDFITIQTNAHCSDQYFRNHFLTMMKSPQLQTAFKGIKTAIQQETEEKPKETTVRRSKLAKYDE